MHQHDDDDNNNNDNNNNLQLPILFNDADHDVCYRFTGDFTMDVIASTAFGLQVNSQKERDNPFVMHAWMAFQAIRISNPVLLAMSE